MKILEHNVLTGEIIERDATEIELANYAQIQSEAKAQAKADADRAKAKAVVIAKLGLTAEEVAVLLS
jgi:hypothetical protein